MSKVSHEFKTRSESCSKALEHSKIQKMAYRTPCKIVQAARIFLNQGLLTWYITQLQRSTPQGVHFTCCV